METVRIFYSWQSDRDRRVCGRFIEIALQEAIGALQPQFGPKLILDSGTEGVAGTPPVSETILRKIRECDVFVGDVSFVGETPTGKLLPNPNVMTEFGYARGMLDDQRILLVMNSAFGAARDLPFDMAHLRHPTSYSLEEKAADGARRSARTAFAQKIAPYLEASVKVALADRTKLTVNRDIMAPAHALLFEVNQLAARGDVPAVVRGPRLVLRMAPVAATRTPPLEPQRVKEARRHLVPQGYDRLGTSVDTRQWASYDPPRYFGEGLNPESRWYARLVRPGVLECSIMVGARIDNDQTIIVEGLPLEGRIVELAGKFATMLCELGLEGPVAVAGMLLELEDAQIMDTRRASRPLKVPALHLGLVDLTSLAAVTSGALRPLLDALWLGAGFEDGSPSFQTASWAGETDVRRYEPVAIGGRAWR